MALLSVVLCVPSCAEQVCLAAHLYYDCMAVLSVFLGVLLAKSKSVFLGFLVQSNSAVVPVVFFSSVFFVLVM
eukprot:JP438955.1.p3 GENE.JP438955.1~~JP438955.1.p3  ORF type:complete len:73 (-),score=12.05 JP438955.1:19-237(-)